QVPVPHVRHVTFRLPSATSRATLARHHAVGLVVRLSEGGRNVNILIALATRHGSPREIPEARPGELPAAGHPAELREAGDFDDGVGYDAVVVGSAIYMGDWLPEARAYVERNRALLATVPVWLFSSGPLGRDDPQPKDDPRHLAGMVGETGARGHRIFVGKLDVNRLGL